MFFSRENGISISFSFFFFFFHVVLLLSDVTATLASPTLPRFNEDGTLKIVQFTDLHFGEGVAKDNVSVSIMSVVLDLEKPNLVVLTGDMISGYAWDRKTRPWFAPLFEKLVAPIHERGIPTIYAIGNHDGQGDITNRQELMSIAISQNPSLSHHGPLNVTGGSNFNVPIISSSGDHVAANLWIMDTGENNCLGVPGWDCADPDQVSWFRDANKRANREAIDALKAKGLIPGNATHPGVPGMMWMHIPVREVMEMWNFQTVKGRLQDIGVCCPSLNTGLYSAAKEAGNIVSMAFGHDHDNTFIGDFFGITLAYGLKSGVGGYGPPPDIQRGARVWLLHEPPADQPLNLTFDTWLRQENGAIHDQLDEVHPPDPKKRFHVCCDAVLKDDVAYKPRLPECERYARQWQIDHFGEIYVRQFMDADADPNPDEGTVTIRTSKKLKKKKEYN